MDEGSSTSASESREEFPTTPGVPVTDGETTASHDEAHCTARLQAILARYGDDVSPARRRALRDILAGLVSGAARLRTVPFDNADEPEIVFRPYRGEPTVDRLGDGRGENLKAPPGAPLVTPWRDEPLDLVELAQRLRGREISAVKLAEAALDRLDTTGRDLNAVVTLARERALDEAAKADDELARGIDRGPLHGMPYGAKDLLATADLPTTWGAPPLRDQRFDFDATVVRKLRDAGAVLTAKLATVELAGGFGYNQPDAALTGPGRNAWDRDAWAGGSSSGVGAAIGAGCVPFGIGSETWGSILNPAAFNGVTGLRPTYGRVSRHGAMALAWTLDKIGPIARSAADCALVLSVIAGRDDKDRTTVDQPFDMASFGEPPPGGYRLAMPCGMLERVQPAVRDNFTASLDVIREFATIEVIELPDYPYNASIISVVLAEAATAFAAHLDDPEFRERLAAPEDRFSLWSGLTVSAVEYLTALRVRRQAGRLFDDVLAPYDGLIAPGQETVAAPITGSFDAYFASAEGAPDQPGRPDLNAAANLLGLPSVVIPNGFGERGLPTAIQVLGRAWDEAAILGIAHNIQLRTDWHRRLPPSPHNEPTADSRQPTVKDAV